MKTLTMFVALLVGVAIGAWLPRAFAAQTLYPVTCPDGSTSYASDSALAQQCPACIGHGADCTPKQHPDGMINGVFWTTDKRTGTSYAFSPDPTAPGFVVQNSTTDPVTATGAPLTTSTVAVVMSVSPSAKGAACILGTDCASGVCTLGACQ